jgi:hypothetical protein
MKRLLPQCPSCKKEAADLSAFEGHRFGWQNQTCDCGHTCQIRYTEYCQFETRPISADLSLPKHFALGGNHQGQEI